MCSMSMHAQYVIGAWLLILLRVRLTTTEHASDGPVHIYCEDLVYNHYELK